MRWQPASTTLSEAIFCANRASAGFGPSLNARFPNAFSKQDGSVEQSSMRVPSGTKLWITGAPPEPVPVDEATKAATSAIWRSERRPRKLGIPGPPRRT
jgi:hypothetical protein